MKHVPARNALDLRSPTFPSARLPVRTRARALAILILLVLANVSPGATWWADADAVPFGSGTEDSPFLTLAEAIEIASGGDTIRLQPGSYGGIDFRSDDGAPLFQNGYVTIRPAPGVTDPEAVSLGHIRLARGWPSADFTAFVRFEGLRLADGAYLERATHVQFADCLIERIGPWVDSVENIEKVAVGMRAADEILIERCEITRTGTALTLNGTNIVARDNHIHDITHDGIRIISVHNGLVANNRIHNLDDGVEDGDADWNRHCDAVHLYIPGPGDAGSENRDVTIRGNLIYNCESQGLQAQGYYGSDNRNINIVIENNVFGPTRANSVNIVEKTNFTFRHNTLVPGTTSFSSAALDGTGYERVIECDNNIFRVPGDAADYAVYNNFLIQGFKRAPGCYADFNAYHAPTVNDVLARNEITVSDPRFVDAEGNDFRLLADSGLINAGTRVYASGPGLPPDPVGVSRDDRPDIGAYEFSGLAPDAEPPIPTFSPPAYRFLDDFRDANIGEDPALAGKHQQGLAWFSPTPDPPLQVASRSSAFSHSLTAIAIGRSYTGTAWAMTTIGDDWEDIELRLGTTPAQDLVSGGILVRANTALEGYYIDLVDGSVTRREQGPDNALIETVLADLGSYLLPSRGGRYFLVSVVNAMDGVRITVRSEDGGTPVLSAIDPDKTFPTGRIALYNESDAAYKRIDFGDIRLELPPPPSTYAGFVATFFTASEAEDAQISAPQADPDRDGEANFVEFALGTDPRDAASIPRIEASFEGDGLQVDFRRLAPPNSVRYRFLSSFDLRHWSETAVPPSLPEPDNGAYESVSVDASPTPETPVRFFKLEVFEE